MRWISEIINLGKSEKDNESSFTLGEVDNDNFSHLHVDGEKTNLRMLVFSVEQIERLNKIIDELTQD